MTRDHQNGKVQSKNGVVVVFEKRDCLVKKNEIIVIVLQMLHHPTRDYGAAGVFGADLNLLRIFVSENKSA